MDDIHLAIAEGLIRELRLPVLRKPVSFAIRNIPYIDTGINNWCILINQESGHNWVSCAAKIYLHSHNIELWSDGESSVYQYDDRNLVNSIQNGIDQLNIPDTPLNKMVWEMLNNKR